MQKLSSTLSGIAGEYFVAAELSRRGCIASVTLRNTHGVDILASNANGTKTVAIQVKTRQKRGKKLVMNEKAEVENVAETLFYVFVSLNGLEQPTFHIVPRNVVARRVRQEHAKWFATPGKRGQAHKATSVREFRDLQNEFLNQWRLLGLGLE